MPRIDLDVMDGKILKELQNDARQSNVELAKRVGLSPSPCLARVRAMEKSGVIGRYVALINPEIVGLGVSVFIQVTLERQVERKLEAFEARMVAFPEVMECYLMTGDSDYLIRILVRANSEVERFIVQKLSTIEGVANIKSSFALKQVKYKTEITIDQ